ncbi:asparagine synthase (glutamine-hydrolyzing) [uncultured Amphritea sp.]|uniref:asparagine synthase (glutamine-hydrolyzing) n=1 Tax=uncultured Amphritea sp. TaxID=981605 RepID=UPI00260834C0|nr:asparagine synthase (glutamine-hydrolyzing) [uncultured Amphritea sp.]
MCGIYGYFDTYGLRLSDSVLSHMGKVINHRGPDGNGCYHDEARSVALGNQRLAILDVEHGHQPFISDDRSIIVVQNGEIFNHVELAADLRNAGFDCKTHCDTEVILRLYERDGIEGISKLNGMFAIAIYDKAEERLFLVRDRVGEKPLYYHYNGTKLLFGSEIKSILKGRDSNFIPSPEAIDQFLTYNYIPPPLTIFEGIYHVMPGHYLEVSKEGVKEKCWWDIARIKEQNFSESEWIEKFNALLEDSVRLRLRSDVPFGAFLSGGVDSSSVVGLMSKCLNDPVRTFCIGFDDVNYDESPYAFSAAERFRTCHKMQKVKANLIDLWPLATYHCDQPHGDVSFLPTYKVASLAVNDVKMVLTGDGADELFAGYDKYKSFFANDVSQMSDLDFQEKYIESISLFNQCDKSQLYTTHFKQTLNDHDSIGVARYFFNKSSTMDRINQALYIDFMMLLPGNNLVKPDRMGMAVSLETRAPFLDYRMMELAFSMPGSLKLKNGETKYIYKKAVAPLIGKDLAYRKKQMFTVPVGEWFKDELLPLCQDLLLSERAQRRNIFDVMFLEKILYEHIKGISNYTRQIRAIMALEIWFREFIDD